jgi:hypothetical protein
MSEAINKMNIVVVGDSRLQTEEKQTYAVIKGSTVSLMKAYASSSLSSSSVSFNNINPSNYSTFVSKQFDIQVSYLVTFTGTCPEGANLLDTWGVDMAPRCMPINSTITNTSIQLNTSTFDSDTNDILPYVTRVDFDRNRSYLSQTATTCDQSQQYSELCNAPNPSNRNPLSAYGVGQAGSIPNRGSGQYKLLTNTPTSATLLMSFSEPLLCSPLTWSGHDTTTAFTYLTNVTIQCQFDNQLSARLLSISNNCVSTFSNITVVPQSATIQFTYFTPSIISNPPRSINYPYYKINRFITDNQTPLQASNSTQVVCNSLQISSNPKAIIIFIKPTRSTITPATTDTFCRIDKISLEYQNKAGTFSSTQPQQLYSMSKNNLLDMSFDEWYGHPKSLSNNLLDNFTRVVSGVGGMVCINPVLDMGLGVESSGSSSLQTLQISVDYTSLYRDNIARLFSVYVLVINDGIVNLSPAVASQQDSIVSPSDLLMYKSIQPAYTNADVLSAQGNVGGMMGGSFFGDVGRFFKNKAIPWIKQHGPEVVSIAKQIAPLVGLGCGLVGGCHSDYQHGCSHCEHVRANGAGVVGGMYGRGLVGGKAISKKSLKSLMY